MDKFLDHGAAHFALEEARAYEKLLASHERLRVALENCVAVSDGVGGTRYHAWSIAREALAQIPKGE